MITLVFTSGRRRGLLVFKSGRHQHCGLWRSALVFKSGQHRDCRRPLWSLRPDDIETVEVCFGLYVGTTSRLLRTSLVFTSRLSRSDDLEQSYIFMISVFLTLTFDFHGNRVAAVELFASSKSESDQSDSLTDGPIGTRIDQCVTVPHNGSNLWQLIRC